MTDNQMIEAIAEAEGRQKEYCEVPTWDYELGRYTNKTIAIWRGKGQVVVFENLPDYLNDLNAMHRVVNDLPPEQLSEWGTHLTNVVFKGSAGTDWNLSFARVANATARQRAEAFLRTLNLWEESQ